MEFLIQRKISIECDLFTNIQDDCFCLQLFHNSDYCCCDKNTLTKSKQRQKRFILPQGSRGDKSSSWQRRQVRSMRLLWQLESKEDTFYTHMGGKPREKEHKWGQAAQPQSLSLVRCFFQYDSNSQRSNSSTSWRLSIRTHEHMEDISFSNHNTYQRTICHIGVNQQSP